MDALTEHYSSPGRLADYWRRFERVSRVPGSDPSVFAVELETFAMRAFGNLSPLTSLQLVRDQFIAGQVGCTHRRHLDSVEPETPIQDIVDRCRMWESCGVCGSSGRQPHPETAPSCLCDRRCGDGEWPNRGDCGYYSGGSRTARVVDATFVTYSHFFGA